MNLPELSEEIAAATWPDGGPAREKEFAQSLLLRFCEVLKEESRDPDEWEAQYALAAVGAITGKMYQRAVTWTSIALAPKAKRPEMATMPLGPVTLAQLHSAVTHLRQSTVPGG